MAKPSIIPLIASVLEPYLEERQQAWEVAGRRTPTLPATAGKVNVRQVVLDLQARDDRIVPHHEQHLFTKPELRAAVNAIAAQQGLATIGSRAAVESNEAARRRIGQLADETSELRQVVAEREAVIDALRRENTSLRAQLSLLEETGMTMRTGSAR